MDKTATRFMMQPPLGQVLPSVIAANFVLRQSQVNQLKQADQLVQDAYASASHENGRVPSLADVASAQGMMREASAIRQKLAASFPNDLRQQIHTADKQQLSTFQAISGGGFLIIPESPVTGAEMAPGGVLDPGGAEFQLIEDRVLQLPPGEISVDTTRLRTIR